MAEQAARDDAGDTPDILGYVARTWDSMWALRLTTIVLFADVWLARRTGTGLIAWHVPPTDTWIQSAGEVVAAVLTFAIVMSVAIPFISLLAQKLTNAFANMPDASQRNEYDGYVMEFQLRDYAHRHNDTMALQVADKHAAREAVGDKHADRVATLLFGIFILGILDLPIFLPAQANSLMGLILSFAPWTAAAVTIAAIGVLTVVRSIWVSSLETPRVRYRPAADELVKARQEAFGPVLAPSSGRASKGSDKPDD